MFGKRYRNISAGATTVLKTGKGRLYAILNNKATASGVITVYDNTAASGTRIATITNPGTLLHNQYELNYQGLEFNTGLTVVTSTTDDITVVYE